jgi:hypothetical protein
MASTSSLGYLALMEQFALRCPDPRVKSRRSTVVRSVTRNIAADESEEALYPSSAYRARTGPAENLEFALKHETLELAILAALFEKEEGRQALQAWLASAPASKYARMAGHLYEWITRQQLPYELPRGTPRLPILDPAIYVVGPPVVDKRFNIIGNMIGTRNMSPIVRRTQAIETDRAIDVKQQVANAMANIDPDLLDRAVNFLYLAETRSSFAIEREIPDHEREERYRRLLERAGAPGTLDQDTLVTWQHEVLDPRRADQTYRHKQNWLSRGNRERGVEYVPPAPNDVDDLMQGVSDIAAQGAAAELHPVVAATCASFGMVYVHPFLDGNGRLHRFLLHHILRQCGVTPPGVVLPISLALEKRIQEYRMVLQEYSTPRTRLLEYRLDPDASEIYVKGPQPAWLYAYFDATHEVHLVYQCIEQALTQDLPAEIDWLKAYDSAMSLIKRWLDGPQSEIDLLVRLIVQNGGRLSNTKRPKFERYTDLEIGRTEEIVREAFAAWTERYRPVGTGAEAVESAQVASA